MIGPASDSFGGTRLVTTEPVLQRTTEGAVHSGASIAEAERCERERLAEALCDDALQRLLVARQELAEAQGDPDALRAAERRLGELTDTLRALTSAMHEETLVTLPLPAALERLAEGAAHRGRLAVRTHVDPTATSGHDAWVLGVVRELLGNVVEHAAATRADVAVLAVPDALVVRVTDDGRGMSLQDAERAGRAGHLGHGRLRRRLAAVGGTLELTSAPAAGTTATCTLPLAGLAAQRTLEDALRRERRWSAALVAAMQDGFAVLSGGVVVQVNDRFCALTGFAREDVVGTGADGAPFWPPEEFGRLEALVAEARTAGGAEARTEVVRADGSRFGALVVARTIRDGDGGVAGTLVTLKDLTALDQAAERGRLELELGAVVATTNRLRGLLDAARAVTDEVGLQALLRELARTIAEDLGWAVVINLYRPAWDDFIVAVGHGVPPEGWEVLAGATYQWPEWTSLLDGRFERRGAYVIPAGEPADGPDDMLAWTSAVEELEGPDAWRVDDALLIPFRHSHGHFLGILSLDAPASGRRPSDAELDVLVAIAAHAALAVQHAQTAIETARHVAALDRLLYVSSRIAAAREVGPILDVVAHAIAVALGFGRVAVETVGEDGLLRPRATREREGDGVGAPPAEGLRPGELAMLLDPAFGVEGCFLLGPDEAADRMPAARRARLGSRRNGRGWRAWEDHVLLVPLRGADDRVVGVIWVDDPVDRLLPGAPFLKALRAFADQATAALVAADRPSELEGASDGDEKTGSSAAPTAPSGATGPSSPCW